MKPALTLFAILFCFAFTVEWAAAQGHVVHVAKLDSAKAIAFVGEVRDAIDRFSDRNNAVAAGYRLIGPDFPGMGEHWVQPREIVRRSVDPRRPSVLSYVVLNGAPVLTGAAFALPVSKGESLPILEFGDVWHVHEGTVEEETLILNPNVRLRGTESDYSLAMFHVWTELENPDGMFAQDNWTLPFFRLGLEVPANVTPAAGKAIFLMNGGDAYYSQLLRVAADPDEQEMRTFETILARYAAEVTDWVGSTERDLDLTFLEDAWTRLWNDLLDAASDEVREQIRELRN